MEPIGHKFFQYNLNESSNEYMGRIIRHFGEKPKNDLTDHFIKVIIEHPSSFKKIIRALPTCHIKGNQFSLYQQVVQRSDNSLLQALVKRMLKNKELSLPAAQHALIQLKSLESLAKFVRNETAKAQQERLSLKQAHDPINTGLVIAIAENDTKSVDEILNVYAKNKQFFPLSELLLGTILSQRFTLVSQILNAMSREKLAIVLKSQSPFDKSQDYVFDFTFTREIVNGEPIECKKHLWIKGQQNLFLLVLDHYVPDESSFFKKLMTFVEFSDDSQLIALMEPVRKHPYFRYLSSMVTIQTLGKVLNKQTKYHFHPQKKGHSAIVARFPDFSRDFRKIIKQALITNFKALIEMGREINSPFHVLEYVRRNNFIGIKIHLGNDVYEICEAIYPPIHSIYSSLWVKDANGGSFVISGQQFSPALESLARVLKGNKLELRDTTRDWHSVEIESIHKPIAFWTDWRTTLPDAWKFYHKLLHPILCSVVLRLIADKNNPCILEICGGAGKLADLIIKGYDRPMEYVLLDTNPDEIFEAQQLLGNRAKALNKDVVTDEYSVNANVVVGSGALTMEVLRNKDAALMVLRKAFLVLKPGGYMVLAGLGNSLVNSQDLKDCGLKVINTYLPNHALILYIAQKP